MREIKFRAWVRCGDWEEDGEKRKFEMVGSDSFAFEEFAPISQLLVDIPDEQYIMQFTGLKDKNGEEIYEGDILAHAAKGVVEFNPYLGFCIRWDDHTARIRREETSDGMPENLECAGSPWEVIGDIYSNPQPIGG